MACRLFGAKPLSEPMLPCCQLEPKENILLTKFLKDFIKENALKNVVCKMSAMLSRPQYVKLQQMYYSQSVSYNMANFPESSVLSSYNMAIFHHNTHNIVPITHTWGPEFLRVQKLR